MGVMVSLAACLESVLIRCHSHISAAMMVGQPAGIRSETSTRSETSALLEDGHARPAAFFVAN